jgi:integral membrane protein
MQLSRTSAVGRVRTVGYIEGTSALILFFIAMPLKYLSGMPDTGKSVVFWVGLVHGLLFISYATVTFIAWGKGCLTAKLVGLAALASIVPFGPFVIDRRLRVEEHSSGSLESCGTGQSSYDDIAR